MSADAVIMFAARKVLTKLTQYRTDARASSEPPLATATEPCSDWPHRNLNFCPHYWLGRCIEDSWPRIIKRLNQALQNGTIADPKVAASARRRLKLVRR